MPFVKIIAFVILLSAQSFQNIFSQYDFTEVDKVLDSKNRVLGGNVCALIIKDNKVVYNYNAGKYNENTPDLIASCSKWLTAALVMTFVDEGKLSVNDPVSKYLPEFSDGGKDKILIKNCLSHTTGIQSSSFKLRSIRERKQYATLAEEVSSFANEPMINRPGTVFAYGNKGLNIAGRILEVISGKDFETLFQERIARPLEMWNTTFLCKQAVNPSGSATSTAADYMKFLYMILNNGNFKGKQIISEKSIIAMQTSQTSSCSVDYAPEQAEGVEYGFGEWIHKKDINGRGIIISSPGLFGSYPYINREGNFAVMLFVKNLKTKNRKVTYSAIQKAIGEVLIK
jgi:CubicO group peptidase (beta-lactamase class C family)